MSVLHLNGPGLALSLDNLEKFKIMKRLAVLIAAGILGGLAAEDANACTGIALTAKDGSRIVARTVEWAATPMECGFVIAPRGHEHQSYTPDGLNGLKYKGIYGYVGIYTEYEGKKQVNELTSKVIKCMYELIEANLNNFYFIDDITLNEAQVTRNEGYYIANLSIKIDIMQEV